MEAVRVKLELGVHTIVSKLTIKSLGMMIDAKVSYGEHLEYACQKAVSDTAVFSNVGGPKHCQRSNLYLCRRKRSQKRKQVIQLSD